MPDSLNNISLNNVLKYISVLFSDFQPIKLLLIVADIAIVAVCIYSILIIVRDTRAWQLLKGIFFIILASYISKLIGLKTVAYVTDAILSIVGIAIVVIFAPELRKMLEQLGRSNVKNIIRFDDQSQKRFIIKSVIDEIAIAATNMSRDKTGALIVIERNTKLGDIINTGRQLDAIVSAPLLENIFVTKTPLHDGAVLIRNDRIVAAACFLPLTSNNNISLKYGSRHRAAIGISEVSDAVTVAVSEERGDISLVFNGNIQKMADAEMLRKELVEMLISFDGKHSGNRFNDTINKGINKLGLKKKKGGKSK